MVLDPRRAGDAVAAVLPFEAGLRIKRAHDPPAESDGYRVLIDRLWPRGLKKEQLALSAWEKELAPTDTLRRWFGHDRRRWDEFARRYRDELRLPAAQQLIRQLAVKAAGGPVTLVYGAQDRTHNNAIVLLGEILRQIGAP